MIEAKSKHKFSLKLKVFVLVVALLAAGSGGYYVAQAVTSTSVPVYLQDLPSTASYVIKTSGSGASQVYWAVKADGSIPYSGTNASQIIQNSFDALTSGRSWCETVVFKGEFTINARIQVPEYVTLDCRQAKFILANGVNNNMFFFSESNVNLIGGVFDGNKAGQTTGDDLLLFYRCDNLTVEDTHIKNAFQNGMYIFAVAGDNYSALIMNNFVEGCRFYGITLRQGYQGARITGNVLKNNADSNTDFTGSIGVYYSDGAIISDNVIINTISTEVSVGAIHIRSSAKCIVTNNHIIGGARIGIHSWKSPNAIISNNKIEGVGDAGMYLTGIGMLVSNNAINVSGSIGINVVGESGEYCDYTKIVGNLVYHAGLYGGIDVGGAAGSSIIGNTILDCVGDGIDISCHNCTIQANTILDEIGAMNGYSINVHSGYDYDFNLVLNNLVKSGASGGIQDAGEHNVIHNNMVDGVWIP